MLTNLQKVFVWTHRRVQHIYQNIFLIAQNGDNLISQTGDQLISQQSDY